MSTDDTCRFCFDGPESKNPLVSPCNCKGSMKYVHVQCIKKWRVNTINPEWHHKCQLCLSDFEVLLRWQKEDLPRHVLFLNILTKRPIVLSFMLVYLHITILSFVPTLNPKLQPQPAHEIISSSLSLKQLYYTNTSYLLYLSMLSATTCIYAITYYNSFWKYIKNKKLYVYLWFSCISSESGRFNSPLLTIFKTLLVAVFTFHLLSPTMFMYIYMLSCIYETHMTIIRQINVAAEIF
jgi:hypothetical protein